MRRKLAVTAVIGAMLAAGPGAAQMAQAVAGATPVFVPCRVSALVSGMTGAGSGETLSLATGCRYLLTEGLPVVSHDLSILGHGATLERSRAQGTAPFTILTADSGNLTIRMLNFRNGNGAISVGHDAALTVDGGIFTGNTAADGGAIYDQSIGGPEVNGATFIANTATDSGGAICISGEDGGTIQHSAFVGNKAEQAGGGISASGITAPLVSASTFTRNTAEYGGALYLNPGIPEGSILSHTVVRDNKATSDGGGIYTFNLDIIASEISGNHSDGNGGGLFNGGLDSVSVHDTIFRGNSARDGGGIYNSGGFGGIDLVGSTISGNHASADGGGIYNGGGDFPGVVSFEHSMISENFSAASGGGVYNQGYIDAAHTRIVRNMATLAGGGIDDDRPPAAATLTNSLVLDNKPDNCQPPDSITDCTG